MTAHSGPTEVRITTRSLRDLVVEVSELRASVRAVRELHTQNDDRCRTCVAGYDPKTDRLVMAGWPCRTVMALDDPEWQL